MDRITEIYLSWRTPERTMNYKFYFFVLLLGGGLTASAQQFLTGKVYVKGTTDTLISVSIHNITQQHYDLSDEDGSYRNQAMGFTGIGGVFGNAQFCAWLC